MDMNGEEYVEAKLCPVTSATYPLQCCRVSPEIARRMLLQMGSSTAHSCVVRIAHSQDHQAAVYALWLGEICSGQNRVEVSEGLLRDMNLEMGMAVHVLGMTDIPIAKDVSLRPLSHYDWNVASTQAHHIEENLLRSIQLVARGHILSAQISSSLCAKFIVEHISAHRSSGSTGGGDGLNVARINNTTSLLIAPFTPDQQQSSPTDAMTADDFPSKFSNASRIYPLRVLPQAFRFQDSSLPMPASLPTRASIAKGLSDDWTDGLAALGSHDDDPSIECSQPVFADWADRLPDKSDICTAYIHPLVVQAALEIALARQVSWEDLTAMCSAYPVNQWLGYLSPHPSAGSASSSSSSALTNRLVLKLQVSTKVRPFYLSMPLSARKALQLDDLQSVALCIVLRDRGVLPSSLRLRPLCWSPSSPPSLSSSPLEGLPLAEVSQTAVLDALVHLIEQSSPLVLCHRQVLSLALCPPPSSPSTSRHEDNQSPRQGYTPRPPVYHDFLVEIFSSSSSFSSNASKSDMQSSHGKVDHVVLDLWRDAQLVPRILDITQVDLHNPLHASTPLHEPPRDLSALCPPPGISLCSTACHPAALSSKDAIWPLWQWMHLCLHPMALLQTCHTGLCPSTTALVTGPRGVGKSYGMTQVCHKLQSQAARWGVQVYPLGCRSLVDLPLDQILERLSQAMNYAVDHAPCLLILDDIDSLCPRQSSETAVTRDDKSLVCSIHLARWIHHLVHRMRTEWSLSRALLCTPTPSSSSCAHLEAQAILRSLSHTVVVLATAISPTAVDASLLACTTMHHLVELSRPPAPTRLDWLHKGLHQAGVPLSADWTGREREEIGRATEGLVAGDLQRIIQRLRARVLCQTRVSPVQDDQPSASSPPSFVSTAEDVLAVLHDYLPLSLTSSSASSSSSSLSTFLSPAALAWSDLGGYSSLRATLRDLFITPRIYRRLYAHSPLSLSRSVLLYGLPGCGKTALAQAIGQDFGVGFLTIRGPQLLDKYIGNSEKALRQVFLQARSLQRPVLLFFDEFEALAPKRGRDHTGVTDRVVNQLLTFLDGVETLLTSEEEGQGEIFLIAATSRPELIDPALLRPGRIETHLYVGLPSLDDRREILTTALQVLEKRAAAVSSTTRSHRIDWSTARPAIEEIVSHVRSERMTCADWQAVVTTAYLLAVQEYIAAERIEDERRAGNMAIQGRHVLAAFQETQPSLSQMDLERYSAVYARFTGRAGRPALHRTEKKEETEAKESEKLPAACRAIKDQKLALM